MEQKPPPPPKKKKKKGIERRANMSYQKGMVPFIGKKSVVNSGKNNTSASRKDFHDLPLSHM